MPYWCGTSTSTTSVSTIPIWITSSTSTTTTVSWIDQQQAAMQQAAMLNQYYQQQLGAGAAIWQQQAQHVGHQLAGPTSRQAAVANERARLRYERDARRHDEDARAKARALLLRHLTEEQREQFLAHKAFVVIGGKSGVRYRIRDEGHMIANVDVVDAGYRLCGHCDTRTIPIGDQPLAQKLMIEGDEEAFVRIANRHYG
jgi:hypothetical protein